MNSDTIANLKAVLWDMDGTLVDTAELHYQAWLELARESALPFSREAFEATFGRRNPEIVRDLFGANLSDAQVQHLGERKEQLYRAAAQSGLALLPGVHALLAQIRAAGILQAIASSAPRTNLELILNLSRTAEFFSALVGMEDCRKGKPDPEVFLIAAERLQVEPNHCLVIEDAVAGVQAAKTAGMPCIAVAFTGHHELDELRQAGADLAVATLEEVSLKDTFVIHSKRRLGF